MASAPVICFLESRSSDRKRGEEVAAQDIGSLLCTLSCRVHLSRFPALPLPIRLWGHKRTRSLSSSSHSRSLLGDRLSSGLRDLGEALPKQSSGAGGWRPLVPAHAPENCSMARAHA